MTARPGQPAPSPTSACVSDGPGHGSGIITEHFHSGHSRRRPTRSSRYQHMPDKGRNQAETRPLSLQPAHSWLVRMLLRLLAIVSLGLGIIGAFLPGLPTTVFVLIAAWAAARSSPPLHAWLLRHPLFGPALENWNNGRCVSRRAKRTAAIVMSISAVWLAFAIRPGWVAGLLIACMATVLTWLWRRPEPPSSDNT